MKYHPIGSFWVVKHPLNMLVKTFALGDGSILCQLGWCQPWNHSCCVHWAKAIRWLRGWLYRGEIEDGISKKKGFLKRCPLLSTMIGIHSNIGSYTTRNAQLKIIHNRIWNDWSPYILRLVNGLAKRWVRQRWWPLTVLLDAFKLCWVGWMVFMISMLVAWVWWTKPKVVGGCFIS